LLTDIYWDDSQKTIIIAVTKNDAPSGKPHFMLSLKDNGQFEYVHW